MIANSLIELDRAHLVHPVAALRSHEARGATILQSAEGRFLTDAEGNRVLDGFAGLWCVNTGYDQDSIVLGILFIVDEVITGFGRTGPMFACEHEGLIPDFMTIAKGLTAGYCPIGAALISDRIYQVIADAAPEGVAMGHGLTYSGHPISAAVGLEVLKLYRGGLINNSLNAGAYFEERLNGFRAHPLVGDVRAKGLLGAIELVSDKTSKSKPADKGIGPKLAKIGYENRLIFRAFNDGTLGFAPSICITRDEIDMLIEHVEKPLDAVTKL